MEYEYISHKVIRLEKYIFEIFLLITYSGVDSSHNLRTTALRSPKNLAHNLDQLTNVTLGLVLRFMKGFLYLNSKYA